MSDRAIILTTHLPAPLDEVWGLLMCPATLEHVAAPLLRFRPEGQPLPDRWEEGSWRVRLRGPFGLPLGWQEICVSFPEAPPPLRRLRDDGRGTLAHRWDHLIEIAPEGSGTRYANRIVVEAGWLTPMTRRVARIFYAHRQWRWRRLLSSGKPRRDPAAPPRA
jgi:hypothetical protein